MADDLQEKIKDLKLNDKSDINILLLGETGVGKSTFINSIANYLTHTDLKSAEKEAFLFLIPSKYVVTDKEGVQHTIQVGSEKDKNEYLDTGMSATQDVKTYVFPIRDGKTKVRLIDTPGMGDTRGLVQDNINCENILSYIGQLHELHAICFLFKPTTTRLTIFFRYCIAQILSRLDKSASKNIIFIFTNTRGTDYSPGETLPSLREIIKDIKASPPYVDIPLNKNIFCFDNESVKHLAAVKQGVEFDNTIKMRNRESWQKSAGQCWELIKYIVGDSKNPALKPHFIKSTSAINEARRIITQLSQPLAEIAQLIHDNLFALQRHEEHLNLDKNSLEVLKKKLYMPVINLDITTLTQPVTVCANSKCSEVYKVGETNKWHYKQRCHDPCFLKNVPKEMIGTPELVHCAAMDSSKTCKKCGCDFSIHMHIYYMTKTKEDRIVDPNVQKNINNKERVLENATKLIKDIMERKTELEKEHDIIVKSCARFAHFLQNNAITPFNDAYKGYIEYLIIREKSLGVLSKVSVVHHLQKLLREYEEAKKSFDEALKIQKRLGESDVFVTPQKIQDTIQDLYRLKHNGKKIKELYECQKKSRSKEHEFTEYVHKVISKPDTKVNYKKNKDPKENDDQKKPVSKNKQYNKEVKTENLQRKKRNQSRERGRPITPPPSYQDLKPSDPPSQPRYPRPPPHDPLYSPAAGPTNAYPPTHYAPGHHSPAQYPPGHYPPVQNYVPYPSVRHDPYYDLHDRRKEGGTTIKVVVEKPEQSHSREYIPKDAYPPRDNYSPREYPARDAYPPREYPPSDAYHPREYPPRDAYPPREYPPREAYPPREYPPRDAYPPRDPYSPREYPPRGAYPPYGDHHVYPHPHSAHGPPPSERYPYSPASYGHDQVASGQSSGTTHNRGGYQRRGDYRGRGRGGNSDRGRGGKGQVFANKTQKFKPGNRKKGNQRSNKDSDYDSDTSVYWKLFSLSEELKR